MLATQKNEVNGMNFSQCTLNSDSFQHAFQHTKAINEAIEEKEEKEPVSNAVCSSKR